MVTVSSSVTAVEPVVPSAETTDCEPSGWVMIVVPSASVISKDPSPCRSVSCPMPLSSSDLVVSVLGLNWVTVPPESTETTVPSDSSRVR